MLGMTLLAFQGAQAGQPIETETARLAGRGAFELEGGYERQTSTAGTAAAVPFALECGLTDRMELLVEPVAYTAIRDKGVRPQTGVGDLEITLTTLLWPERAARPAIALGAEVKAPTAKNVRIGSGRADYSLYLIGSKRTGLWDTHANLGYTVIGRPAGVQINNIMNFALGEELHLSRSWELVGEVFGGTAALKEGADQPLVSKESVLTPEIGGGEFIGMLGARYRAVDGISYSLGISLDSNRAVLVHPGIAFKW
jgi:hypothetical protein